MLSLHSIQVFKANLSTSCRKTPSSSWQGSIDNIVQEQEQEQLLKQEQEVSLHLCEGLPQGGVEALQLPHRHTAITVTVEQRPGCPHLAEGEVKGKGKGNEKGKGISFPYQLLKKKVMPLFFGF